MRASFLLISILLYFPVFGQEDKPTLSVYPNDVQENEAFKISVEAHQDGKVNLNLPNGIEVLGSSRSISSSSSYTVIINGKVQQSTSDKTISYNFTCRASKSGTYSINNATFTAGGKKMQLNNVTIRVNNAPPVSNSLKGNLNKNFFGLINTSRSEVYVGEPIVISSKIYSRARVTDIANYEPSKVSGAVHKTDLFKNRKNLSAKNERIEGIPFQTIEISREVLVPQKAGKISCSPFSIKIGYQSSFFFSDYTNINSGTASIRVLPLPSGAPASFNGAVGKYTVKTKVSETNLKEGDAFTYTVTISGSGNLHLLSVPELDLPESFEMYGDPKTIEKYTINSNGADGSIQYEYIIRVTEKGEYNIQPFKFSYFNPQRKSYVDLTTKSDKITVEKGNYSASTNVGNVEKEIQIKNEGIKYIQTTHGEIGSSFLWEKWLFWVIVLFPFVAAIPIGLWMKKRLAQKETILVNQRYKKAGKFASKKLMQAKQLLDQNEIKAFNDEIHTVFTGYLAQKMKCTTAELTRECIVSKLNNNENISNLSESLMIVWDELEQLKYGLSGAESPQSLLDKTASLIDKIDAQWK